MTKVKMRSKEEILEEIPWIRENDRETISSSAIAEALLDIRDILKQQLMIEDELIKRRIK